jgi:AraC-like DNA-binding protein
VAGYTEFAAAPGLDGRVACVWTSTGGSRPRDTRIVPDGCVDVIWTSIPGHDGGALHVAGPDTTAFVTTVHAGQRFTAIRFRPGAGADVLGVPLHALRDQRVPLPELWGPDADRLAGAMDRSGGDVRLLECLVADRVRAAGDVEPLVAGIIARVGSVPVNRLADDLGVSERHLRRRSVAAFGYGPKTLERVLRFRAAVAQAPTTTGWAELAYRHGYADQAHLAREVRALAGVSLSELVGQSRP